MALIQRKAKLFEAGVYPDRGGEYTEAELDLWCENHKNRTIPLSIGHLDPTGPESPLASLGEHGPGFFANLIRIGKELFATLFIDEQVNDLVERSGARGLSVGIDRENGVIVEGSWVKSPRIASAAMFNAQNVAFTFSGSIAEDEAPQPIQEGPMSTEPKEGAGAPKDPPVTPPTPPVPDAKFAADLEAQKARADAADALAKQQSQELADLRTKLVFAEDEKAFDQLVKDGKLLDSHKAEFMALSQAPAAPITFAGTDEAVTMRPFDVAVKFFETYDPKLVYETQLPKLKTVKPVADAKFSEDDLSEIRRKGEQLGHKGDELEAYVTNTTRFLSEVNS